MEYHMHPKKKRQPNQALYGLGMVHRKVNQQQVFEERSSQMKKSRTRISYKRQRFGFHAISYQRVFIKHWPQPATIAICLTLRLRMNEDKNIGLISPTNNS